MFAAMPIRIPDHLIIPFGKLDCSCHQIRLVAASAYELKIESAAPCVYVDRGSYIPISLAHLFQMFSITPRSMWINENPLDSLDAICDLLRNNCELTGSHQHLFLSLYFDLIAEAFKSNASGKPRWDSFHEQLGQFLLPLPEAHLYWAEGSRCIRANFLFWTGHCFAAVLISENSSREDCIVDEQALSVAGLQVVPISAREMESNGLRGFMPRLAEIQLAGR
jgi:hypothetical protein